MRNHGELSISISVLPAFHFAQHAEDYFVGASAEQDGELDALLAHPGCHARFAALKLVQPAFVVFLQTTGDDAVGSALLEFAISLPLLVVFVVGIYDFSGAFNQKQKIGQAAQEGAIVAGAQPMSDIERSPANPDSLQPVVTAVFNSLAASGVLPNAAHLAAQPCPAPHRRRRLA